MYALPRLFVVEWPESKTYPPDSQQDTAKRVYFAGKVGKGGGYRGRLLGNPRVMSDGYREYEIAGGSLTYGGPFAISDDHGCFHGMNSRHGCGPSYGCTGDLRVEEDLLVKVGSEGLSEKDIVDRCKYQIQAADAIHCFVDSLDCPGTMAEIGYASSLCKPIYLVIDNALKPKPGEKDELWFIKGMCTLWRYGEPETICTDVLTWPLWLRSQAIDKNIWSLGVRENLIAVG